MMLVFSQVTPVVQKWCPIPQSLADFFMFFLPFRHTFLLTAVPFHTFLVSSFCGWFFYALVAWGCFEVPLFLWLWLAAVPFFEAGRLLLDETWVLVFSLSLLSFFFSPSSFFLSQRQCSSFVVD